MSGTLPELKSFGWRYGLWILLSFLLIAGWESIAKYHAPRFIAEWFGPIFAFFGVPALLVIGTAALLGLIGRRAGFSRSIGTVAIGLLAPVILFFVVLISACVVASAMHRSGACI